MNTRYLRSAAIPILVITMIAFFLWVNSTSRSANKNDFPKLYSQIEKNQVDKVVVDPAQNSISVTPDKGAKFKPYELGYATDKDLDDLKTELKDQDQFDAYQVKPDKGPGILGYFLQF